jgi:hypothetical protein
VRLLRDGFQGDQPAAEALTRLHAVQAALFLHGILLRWDTRALGADPAGGAARRPDATGGQPIDDGPH